MFLQFIGFKLSQFLALLAVPQFDVSSQLLFNPATTFDTIKQRLITWDTVYYLSTAKAGGPKYEHEWAFSPLWSQFIHRICGSDDIGTLALCGSIISICSHFLACFAIYMIARVLGDSRKIARSTAGLYVFCPAAMFLTAGYPESTFALVSFIGMLLFLEEHFVLAGLTFGISCLLRSNGLLWGLLFVWSVFEKRNSFKALFRVVLGGALNGLIFLYPQYVAYTEICPGRPWCDSKIPLIYTFVQREYWDNGFLRYWTPNNIPNFLFASPTLLLLIRSLPAAPKPLKLVQIVLFIGALFFWHVQIVTRVASCLPTPYLYLARRAGTREYKLWVSYFIIWGLTQAALFGGFLPPA